ncbi:arp2/3 complex-activating protein rickA-like [Epinephelus moara]|uniref:arp2/3 complex-activating protein rickA-like n=1 Tax=Epinephelus moara TaxID=300413 RepID=UPI00214F000A|nr:arp2/3 complex-activating protein rickA-like [Epinephelus moara]
MATSGRTQRISRQCANNAHGCPAVVVYGDATFLLPFQQISIQCVDNANGFGGVIAYGDQTFPLRFQRGAIGWTVFGDGQGPYSSVRPFQPAHYQNGDVEPMEWGPPQADINSSASSVPPPKPVSSDNGDVEDMDWDPPQTGSNSSASSVPPPKPVSSDNRDVESMDWDPPQTGSNSSARLRKESRRQKRLRRKRLWIKQEDKPNINIGAAKQRRQLRELKGLKSDAEVAVFLLDSSVRPFQPAHYQNKGVEEMDWGPQTD